MFGKADAGAFTAPDGDILTAADQAAVVIALRQSWIE